MRNRKYVEYVWLTLLRPYRSLLHPVVELLHQVQREVGSESVLIEHDLSGQPEVLDLLDVAQHFVAVVPGDSCVAAQRLQFHVLQKVVVIQAETLSDSIHSPIF